LARLIVIETLDSEMDFEVDPADIFYSVFSIPALNQSLPDGPNREYKHKYDELVDENRHFMNALTKILEGPVCLIMVKTSPVLSCHNGHIVCTSCWNMTHLCPLCRVKLHETEKCFSQEVSGVAAPEGVYV
jgi:hypothetical protein